MPFRSLSLRCLCISLTLLSVFSCDARAAKHPEAEARRAKARSLASAMDTRTLCAQVLITGIDGSSSLTPGMASLLENVPAGAVMLFKYNLGRGPEAAHTLSAEASSAVSKGLETALPGRSLPPPFIAVDHEGGSVYRFSGDLTRLPPPRAFGGDIEAVRKAASLSGRELYLAGITLNLAPVAEAVGGDEKSFMYERSYSADRKSAARLASAFILGMDSAGVACAAKHFPGNSETDPHTGLATLTESRAELEATGRSFAAVFAASDPAAVMVSHAVATAVDPGVPSCLSRKVVTDWLKGRLGFEGMVISDDLRMGAIAATGRSVEEAAVEAVNAGVDLVMTWPPDLVKVRDALEKAVEEGVLPRERLEDAVSRVISCKLRYSPEKTGTPADEKKDILSELSFRRSETEQFLRKRGL